MCRNIKTLFNFEPPAADEEIKAASLQYVRKITGFNKPSRANEAAFYSAVENIARISEGLLASLETTAPEGPGRRGGQSKGAFGPTIRRVILENAPADPTFEVVRVPQLAAARPLASARPVYE